ncbi:MAG: hypothetical protein EPN97_01325 [Alphaproteobacteria bacterium]|nr:MAG: hypothetical protein EPN97_01325 [Alphaproteobacteria bacterium]
MTIAAVATEKEASFESDHKAFDNLPPKQQVYATRLATGAFACRSAIVTSGNFVIGLCETAWNATVRLPLKIAQRAVVRTADKAVDIGANLPANTAGGALGLARRGLGWYGGIVKALNNGTFITDETKDRSLAKIRAAQDRLTIKQATLAARRADRKKNAQETWGKVKSKVGGALSKTGQFLEYYGAIGLYRGAKWILDPRLPSGKPLFGHEKLNKAVGFIAAAAIFTYLCFQFSKLLVLGKILHIKLAHSFFTDTSPLHTRFIKQAVLQPAITVGLASLKFVTLPVIAAARRQLKSTPFTQGVAYQYNVKLRAGQERKIQKAADKKARAEAAAKDDTPIVQKGKKAVKVLRHKTFGFIGTFFRHVVEKSSPEWYEARYKHYTNLHEAEEARKTEPVTPPPAETPVRYAWKDLNLSEAFTNAQKPAEPEASPLPASPAPKPPSPPGA